LDEDSAARERSAGAGALKAKIEAIKDEAIRRGLKKAEGQFWKLHRAVNRSGGERYALAFFCDSKYRLAGGRRADLRRVGQTTQVPHNLLHRLHDPLPAADLQRVRY
jgi:hypothetical protein